MSRKQQLDEALLNLIIMDAQLLSVLENEGFRAFVHLLDPTYTIPGRKALKQMLDEKYKVTKDQAVTQVSKASTVSLTADMWTSINMDAYLAVTCHFIIGEVQLSTILLGVNKIPPVPYCSTHSRGQRHSDGRMGNLRQSKESGHRRSTKYGSMCQSPQCAPHQLFCPHVESGGEKSRTSDLDDIRTKAKRIVAHFKSSTTAKEKLSEIQRLMGRPEHIFFFLTGQQHYKNMVFYNMKHCCRLNYPNMK